MLLAYFALDHVSFSPFFAVTFSSSADNKLLSHIFIIIIATNCPFLTTKTAQESDYSKETLKHSNYSFSRQPLLFTQLAALVTK